MKYRLHIWYSWRSLLPGGKQVVGSPIGTTADAAQHRRDSRHRLGTWQAEQALTSMTIAVEDYSGCLSYANLLISWCGIEE